MLRNWRVRKGLTIREGAKYLGLGSFGFLSKIENGLVFPSPEIVITIEAATKGAITVIDHLQAWQRAHLKQFKDFRAAGRAAAKAYKPPAKPKTGDKGGRQNFRVRKARERKAPTENA